MGQIKFRTNIYRTVGALALLIGIFTMTSCLKDEDPQPQNVAVAMMINAVPNQESEENGFILALDNNQLNNLNHQFPEYFLYGETLQYRRVFPGERLFRAYHPQDVSSNDEILSETVDFELGSFYSIFLVGTNDEDMEIVKIKDEVDDVENGEAVIRFMNLSPDAPKLDLFYVNGETETLFVSGKGFKEYSDFEDIGAESELTFVVRTSDSGDKVYEFTFEPSEKYVYTLWMNGFFNQDEAPEEGFDFGHGRIIH